MSTTRRTLDARPKDLVEVLRRARVEGMPIALRAPAGTDAVLVRLVAGSDATVTLDGHNSVAEIDGALTLSSAARRLERKGAIFPLARPLPPLSLAAACAALPFFVDAFVQQAQAVTFDGDLIDTPRAPRNAAGPSLLAALCARPPLALAVRARVRVQLTTHAVVVKEEHASPRDAAYRLRALVDEGRAFCGDACGSTVLLLAGAGVARHSSAVSSPFTHEGRGRRASFSRSQSIAPGDVDAMADALEKGARVVVAPFMGRAASLWRGFEAIPVSEVSRGVRDIADALARGVQ